MKIYLEATDVDMMERVVSCQRDRLLIRLLFRLGRRVSEVLAIRICDIDFDRGTVTILHLKTRIKLSCCKCGTSLGRRHCFCPGCGEEIGEPTKRQQEKRWMRTLPIDRETLGMLGQYASSIDLSPENTTKPIFSLNRHQAWQIVRNSAKRAGLPDLVNPETGRVRGVSPHRLRDAFSVHAIKLDDSGDGLRLLQEHLGHTSFNTTAKHRKLAG